METNQLASNDEWRVKIRALKKHLPMGQQPEMLG